MKEVLPAPRPEISPYAPRVYTMQIRPDKIGLLIGPGGKTIRSIIGSTDSEINIEPDGKVYITAPNENILNTILERINQLLAEPEEGKVYEGVVVDLKDFGALVQILPNYVGLLHISQISDKFIKDIRKELHIGDKVKVKVLKIEDDGKIQLSKKAVDGEKKNNNENSEKRE
jgi:polyribonucleotide nucleotidyltransferase